MDKTTNAESKPDYASVLSQTSQARKVETGTENVLTVNIDEARVPNILCQQVDLCTKSSQSSTILTNSKKQSVKPQSSNASKSCMCHTQYIKSTDKLMICERCDCWCCVKCLKMSSNEYKVLNSRSDCHWFCPECEEQALTDVKFGMDIEAKCRQYFHIIEDIVRLVENQLQNIDHIIKEKVKHEVHRQLNSDMKTILEDEITASRADIENTVIADLSRVVSDKVDNLKDNVERKLKIIVFGAEESASNLKNKRNEDDTKVFIETCQNEVKTNISSNDISKITRLG